MKEKRERKNICIKTNTGTEHMAANLNKRKNSSKLGTPISKETVPSAPTQLEDSNAMVVN